MMFWRFTRRLKKAKKMRNYCGRRALGNSIPIDSTLRTAPQNQSQNTPYKNDAPAELPRYLGFTKITVDNSNGESDMARLIPLAD
jgi:hypothetical protein